MRFSLIIAAVSSLAVAGPALARGPLGASNAAGGAGPKTSNGPKTPVINGNYSSSTYCWNTPNCPKTPVINHGKHSSSTCISHAPNCPKTPINGSSTYCHTPGGKPTVGKPQGSSVLVVHQRRAYAR